MLLSLYFPLLRKRAFCTETLLQQFILVEVLVAGESHILDFLCAPS